jgi:predicted DNA-binding transcriptional regulator YafY
MRASRLLSILVTLQAQTRVTAQSLAQACEVSVRTIYRDIDALSAAGIPVYAERGSEGGYRLLDGYRTRLNGLSAEEAEALFLTGLAGPAADLGLGAAMAMAETKLLAALPAALRDSARRMRERFHLDAPAWFAEPEHPPHLSAVFRALWEERPIRLGYRSWKGERQRTVAPRGLVLKSGAWYLVGQVANDIRTYRIARILDLEILDGRVEPPEGFDLAAYWQGASKRLEAQLRQGKATIRVSPWGLKMLGFFTSPYAEAAAEIASEPDAEGWYRVVLPIGSAWASTEMLRFGTDLEVLEPPELRAKMVETAAALTALYAR